MKTLARAKARTTDPYTSYLAAEKVEPFVKDHEKIILKYLRNHKNATTKDIARQFRFPVPHEKFSRRMKTLEKEGLIVRVRNKLGDLEKRDDCTIWRLRNG